MPTTREIYQEFEASQGINPSRTCEACLHPITEEPGVFFETYQRDHSVRTCFHRDCLVEALRPLQLDVATLL